MKEIALGKRAKISEAQQYMLLAVLGTSILLGIALSLISTFVKQISFNADVITAEDQSTTAYSNVIQSIGICKKPKGAVYSSDELKNCNPDSIEVSEIPDTLRANILVNMAANQALASVPRENDTSCINPKTEKNFTYEELSKLYDDAKNADELTAASGLIKQCSALRIVPDALPAFENQEALLASLNKLFLISGREPESLNPSDTISASDLGPGLNAVVVNFSLNEASTADATNLLRTIEKSIREFNLDAATIKWSGAGTLDFSAQATAFFMNKTSIKEANKTISAEEGK